MTKEQKQTFKKLLIEINQILRTNKLKLELHTNLIHSDLGFIGSLEDNGYELLLINDETYEIIVSSESEQHKE